MAYSMKTLANGVRILLLNYSHLKSVTVTSFVRTGSRNETPEENGISHYLEHLAFKGTPNRTADEINSDMDFLGASMNASTGKDLTKYYISGHNKDLVEFVDFICDITCNSIFPEEEIENERSVIVQEFHKYQDNPASICGEAIDDLAYPGQSAGRKIIGELDNIQNFQRQDFVNYLDTKYTGDNIIVGVVGSFEDEEAVFKMVEERMTTVKSGNRNQLPATSYVGGIRHVYKDLQQSKIRIAFPASKQTDISNHITEMVAASAFGDGFSSPLFSEIREKAGLAYSVWSTAYGSEMDGMFIVGCDTTPENIPELFTRLGDMLENPKSYLTSRDIERAKNGLLVYLSTKSERAGTMLSNYADDLFVMGEIIPDEKWMEAVTSVNDEAVFAAFTRMLNNVPSIAVVGKEVDMASVQTFSDKFSPKA